MDHRLACDTQAPLFWESEPPLTFAHMPPPKSSSARLSPSIWPSILVNSKLRVGYNNPDLPKVFLMLVRKRRSSPHLATERMHPGRALFLRSCPTASRDTVSRQPSAAARRLDHSGPRQRHLFFGISEITLFAGPKSVLYFQLSRPHLRGGSRSSRTRGGMRWTRMALLTRALEADGEVVWS